MGQGWQTAPRAPERPPRVRRPGAAAGLARLLRVSRFDLGLPLIHAGKVRELYALEDPATMLMVASDAISAYDFVLTPEVPDKGAVLTQLSLWWFEQLADVVPHHVLSTDVPAPVRGRAVVCERLSMLPVECVVRGYLTGSGWAEYTRDGTVCGIPLPAGLRDGDRLPEPLFTPATKAPMGEHDENVDFDTVVATIGREQAEAVRELSLAVYAAAEPVARERGIVLADTKLEFGTRADGTIVLADEVLTPDSSRFWDAAQWRPGESLPSFDKQFVRDWLTRESGWDRDSGTPPPPLPAEVVQATRERYLEALVRLTGQGLRV
ncbi:phosphoribosylaminoimidazolesuccinocarboxamide synthase [Auraticoccus sp. F435]|uniref:Phosphoribosylaminoimidazole-succinocarboxamide synthase n=1 Tax=Auraticoccus cholistanensis TaxID=2656650 RepID=A0A6A9UR44_9ACTN|nr:phosphoribosylaminoimidazolesuccinocarboxamide synthase [Auraticoccus cholistanensis]